MTHSVHILNFMDMFANLIVIHWKSGTLSIFDLVSILFGDLSMIIEEPLLLLAKSLGDRSHDTTAS